MSSIIVQTLHSSVPSRLVLFVILCGGFHDSQSRCSWRDLLFVDRRLGVSLAAMATQSPRRHPNFHIRPEWNYFRQSVEVVVSRSDAELRSRSCSSIVCSHVLVEVVQG